MNTFNASHQTLPHVGSVVGSVVGRGSARVSGGSPRAGNRVDIGIWTNIKYVCDSPISLNCW